MMIIIFSYISNKVIKHVVLNAKNHENEAEIIASAGKPSQITVATNMAGRGTDIKIGGNPDIDKNFNNADYQKVINCGGLCILGTERHESRRIDNQLRGRSGRQGDPGSSRFYLSLQDNLMRIFASDRLGGFGLSDIYFTTKKDGSWTQSQNMGPIINTRNNEVSPFYHPLFGVLYFSSNGQLYNFGAFDIYKSYNIIDKWSEPINIGPLVNGTGSEFYFTIDANSKDLYYARSSSKDLDKLDLYSFPLPMGARPDAIAQLKGSLTDALNGKPFGGIVSVVDMDQGVEVAPKYLKEDGTFEFNLIDQRNYLLVIHITPQK